MGIIILLRLIIAIDVQEYNLHQNALPCCWGGVVSQGGRRVCRVNEDLGWLMLARFSIFINSAIINYPVDGPWALYQ